MTKTSLTQASAALTVIDVFRGRLVGGNLEPLRGYNTVASLIGYEGDAARFLGQVASRIDAACFYAGLPMFSLHFIRSADGSLNMASFGGDGGLWDQYRDEIVEMTTSRRWTAADLDAVHRAMIVLPESGARAIWNSIAERGSDNLGFVRYNLHRKVERSK